MIQHKMVVPYMETARAFAKLSKAKRLKVGAIAITPQDVMLYSYNGRPAGDDNNCELRVVIDDYRGSELVTHPEVLHAEANLVAKAAREGISLKGSTVFTTASPCLPCALQLFQAGVSSVVYDQEYRLTDGIDFLRRKKIHCEKYEEESNE